MPDNIKKKVSVATQLQQLKLLNCAACHEVETVQYGDDGVLIFCGVTAGFKDVSPWLRVAEARRCPGKELRKLFLSAPEEYARK